MDAWIHGSCCRCRCCVPEAEAEADTPHPEGAGATLSTLDARSLSRADRVHSGNYCIEPLYMSPSTNGLLSRLCGLLSKMAESRTRRGPASPATARHTHLSSLPSVLSLTAFDISATRAPTDAVEACRRTQASPCPACSNVKCLADVLLLWCLYHREIARIFFCSPPSLTLNS